MKKNKPNIFSVELLVALLLVAAAAFVIFFFEGVYIRGFAIGIIFIATVLLLGGIALYRKNMEYLAGRLFQVQSDKLGKYVDTASIPTAITRTNGRICWCNPAFFLLAGKQCEGKLISRVFPDMDKPEKDKKITLHGKQYTKEKFNLVLGKREYTIYRLVDKETVVMAADLGRLALPMVCHIQIDNYSDLMRGLTQEMNVELQMGIERLIAKHAQSIHAVYQRYDRDNYIMLFERRYFSGLMQSKFSLLEEVRKVDTGVSALTPTLSMGFGAAKNPAASNTNALKALEMALGRGGDQVVFKDEEGFRYFGGIQQGRETRSKVKSRMFAKALRNLMEQCERVIIMGHSTPDLDCMGAALGLLACARRINRPANIVLQESNISIDELVKAMDKDADYADVFIAPDQAEDLIDERTMLIVVDTQIAKFTIAPWIYPLAETTVVIDHHVRGADHIDGATLFLHEPYASSTAEMVTEVVQYFSEHIRLKSLEAESLLAGIMMDTKGFSFKTGIRTFEAASYLRRMGADTTKIRHLFQDDLSTYTARAKVVEQAQVLPNGIAIATCPQGMPNPQLLAAQAADALIGIRGIDASFVLCEQDGFVIISGRSLGETNVQRVLEKMGGGGHATIAGAQIKSNNLKQIVQELKEKIEEYEREV